MSSPVGAELPALLLPYQARVLEDEADVRVVEKSRRIGLSWGLACEAALVAGSQDGMDYWYTGYSRDMAREFIRDVADWAEALQLASENLGESVLDDDGKPIGTFSVRFASGWRVTALSSAPSNLRGKQGHVVIDEAAFHPDLPGMMKSAFALLMWGGRVTLVSTHDGVDNPFAELVEEIRAGKWPYSLHRITLDDALEDGLFRRICLTKKKAWSAEAEADWRARIFASYGANADEELLCIPSQGGGRYFARALVESRMQPGAPVLRFAGDAAFNALPQVDREHQVQAWLDAEVGPLLAQLNPHLAHCFGEDFARSGDATVMVPLALLPNLVRQVPFGVELRNLPFKQQEQVAFYIMDRLPRFTAGALDGRGNGQYLAEVAAERYGHNRIHQVQATEAWYLANVPRYKAALEDGLMLLPASADILTDHGLVRSVKGVPKVPEGARAQGSDGNMRHGDSYIALVNAYFASCQDVVMPEHHSRGVKRASYAGGQDYLGGLG